MPKQRQTGPLLLRSLLKKSAFGTLQQKTSQINSINRLAEQFFAQHNLSQVRVANIRNGVMIIEASSAPWANRLKQLRLPLLSELRKQLPSLVSIEIQINPDLTCIKAESKPKNTPAHRLSRQSASYITNLANEAPPGLKEKLLRLAALSEQSED